MQFHIVTIFPEVIEKYADTSILKRAQKKRFISVRAINPRTFIKDKHKKTDDSPYGGGPGMVMKVEPILRAVDSITKKYKPRIKNHKIIILSAAGKQFTQGMAYRLAKLDSLILVTGRYEGIDARVKKVLKAQEVSIGPYVLSGGELASLVIVEAVARHIPGVLGRRESLEEYRGGVGAPIFTRPETLIHKGKKYRVPRILLSGDHKKIDKWRRERGKHILRA